MLKRFIGLLIAAAVFGFSGQAYAVGVEFALGGWQQSFGGTFGYQIDDNGDILDVDDDFDFDDENRLFGRIKIDTPAPIPNVYLLAAPLEFEGSGSKSVEVTYGELTIPADADLDTKVQLNQLDLAIYWELPFLQRATANVFNVDIGLNVRFVDLEAELHATASGYDEQDSGSITAPIPMLYIGFQITPIDAFAIEGEYRGISLGDNKLYSLIGRARFQLASPVFVAVGYRSDKLEIDEDDVQADIDFSGPFVEVGFKF